MAGTILSVNDVEKINVSIDNVYLDIKNPRFHGENDLTLFNDKDKFDLKNQEVIRQYIVKKYSANEIIESILEVGFIPIDLIVLDEVSFDKFIVVEGNRRIAAIKTIVGNYKRKEIFLNDDVLNSILEFEALKIKNNGGNDELKKWILQGIRHVSGVRGWGPYQQSMLINELHYNHNMSFRDIGKTIGIHYNRVSTMLKAYLSICQMKRHDVYSKYADSSLFSHFEQAYLKKQIRDWLDWNENIMGYANNENLVKFYDMIISKDENTRLMSKNIRDDLPTIYNNKEVFDSLVNNKITFKEAVEKTKTGKPDKDLIELVDQTILTISKIKKSQISIELNEKLLKLNSIISKCVGK